jgi:hypothetical protein
MFWLTFFLVMAALVLLPYICDGIARLILRLLELFR